MPRTIDPKIAELRARTAGYTRSGNLEAAEQTRQELRAARVEAAAEKIADALPPLTNEQRARIGTLLAPALAGLSAADIQAGESDG